MFLIVAEKFHKRNPANLESRELGRAWSGSVYYESEN